MSLPANDPTPLQVCDTPSSLQPQSPPSAVVLPKPMSSHDDPPTSVELDGEDEPMLVGKGKERTIPMPIRSSTIVHDLFDVSPPTTASFRPFESSSSSSTAFSPTSSTFSSPDFSERYRQHNLSIESMEQLESPVSDAPWLESAGKGKGRESFPYLPPLSFSGIKLDCGEDLPLTPGPSSYGTLYSPVPTSPIASVSDRENSISSPGTSSQEITESHVNRCQSLSSLSQPTPSILASLSTTPPIHPPRTPSNLSRQLIVLNQKDNNIDPVPLDPTVQTSAPSSTSPFPALVIPGSYPPSWYTVSKPSLPSLASQADLPIYSIPRANLKPKTRSKSSPYPISVLDFIPNTSTDIFLPIPIIVPNYFDLILPKELRLDILRNLVVLHEQDYQRSVREGRLTAGRASSSRNRWVGKDKGIRELFKLSRVSKGWNALVFDGELWIDIDLRSFHSFPPEVVVRLIQSAGTFVKKLNLAGHVQLHADAMMDISSSLCLSAPETLMSFTQITVANFQGCSSLTTRSLHHFLVRSCSLQTLSVKGLSAVTNTTCDIIANFCHRLTSLNLSRCPNMDGHGIGALTVSAIFRKEHLPLKELRLSGLKHVSDSIMQALGRAAPYLEVLDLSYSRQLHNSALEAFVACEGYTDHQLAVETIYVSPRDLGRETNEGGKLKRRVTRLRHLVLSSCILLTDVACANLAFSVPHLEFLEMGGIGSDLKDAGLIRLLETTPHIRRLDLEDAAEITDALLAAITPPPPETPAQTNPSASTNIQVTAPKHPGYALQYLSISYATLITDTAFLGLIRNCPRLTVLEADNTRLSVTALKEFVRLSRERKTSNAKIVAIDCRGIHEGLVKELSSMTRPRMGWRAFGARKLTYLDARDDNEEELKIGQDECDEMRVVLKTFYSWQTVDAVKAARDKRRAMTMRRTASDSSTVGNEAFDGQGVISGRSARWWSPGGRRSPRNDQGSNSPPTLPDLNGDGCRTM